MSWDQRSQRPWIYSTPPSESSFILGRVTEKVDQHERRITNLEARWWRTMSVRDVAPAIVGLAFLALAILGKHELALAILPYAK